MNAITGGRQHRDGIVEILALEIAIEGVGEEDDVSMPLLVFDLLLARHIVPDLGTSISVVACMGTPRQRRPSPRR